MLQNTKIMQFKKNMLYISTLSSPRVLDYLFRTSNNKPGLAVQKFHHLLVEGFAKNNEVSNVETLSSIPVIPSSHHKRIWNIKSETINNIHYNYIPIINVPVLKNIMVFTYSFFKILRWNLSKKRNTKIVICDVLILTLTASAVFACKITGTKVIAIVTDLPGLMISGANIKKKFINNIYDTLVPNILSKFDGYILLTEQMNSIVNPKHLPYIVMEGLVDIEMASTINSLENKASERILIYSGIIFEKYGIKKLIDAFMKLEDDDLRLHIYGSGDMENDMPGYMIQDNRIKYKGLVPNVEMVQKQLEATLLINPRPSDDEYTKYSFPSKNMEYMVSGTPVVTTPLSGMPKEYYEFVYLFTNESVDGIFETLKHLLNKPNQELHDFGNKAKEFVLTNKSNYIQAGRIINFLTHQHFQ